MLKAIKLEYKKYKKSGMGDSILSAILGGILISMLLTIEENYEKMFFIILLSTTFVLIGNFRNRYNKELKNNLLKNSSITSLGNDNVIKAKLIVSLGLYSIFMITLIIGVSVLNKVVGLKFKFSVFTMILSVIFIINTSMILLRLMVKNLEKLKLFLIWVGYICITIICNYVLLKNLIIYSVVIIFITITNVISFKKINFNEMNIDLK